MRKYIFLFLAFPLLLWAQTDWNKPFFSNEPATDGENVEVQGDSVDPMAVRLDNPSVDNGGERVQKKSDGKIYVEGFDRSGFLSWMTNSRVYYIQGDTATFDRLEPLFSSVPEAKGELNSSKNWATAAVAFAISAVVAGCVGAFSKDDETRSIGLTTAIAGLVLEFFAVRQSNNHYNSAVDIYNDHVRNGSNW